MAEQSSMNPSRVVRLFDGLEVQRVGDHIKMVRGIVFCDGLPFETWMPAYREPCGAWIGCDTGEIVMLVDAVLEFDQLNKLAGEGISTLGDKEEVSR
jgi:hypothetical protein